MSLVSIMALQNGDSKKLDIVVVGGGLVSTFLVKKYLALKNARCMSVYLLQFSLKKVCSFRIIAVNIIYYYEWEQFYLSVISYHYLIL